MERPGAVWAYSIFLGLGVLGYILTILFLFMGIAVAGFSLPIFVLLIFYVIMGAMNGIFLYYFFMLKQKAKTWVNIVFGTSLFLTILAGIFKVFFLAKSQGTEMNTSFPFFNLIVLLVFWWIVRDYIVKKKVNDQLLFSN